MERLSRTIASESVNVCASNESIRDSRNARAFKHGRRMETLGTLRNLRRRRPGATDGLEFVEQVQQAFREIAAGKTSGALFSPRDQTFPFRFVLEKRFERPGNFQLVRGIHEKRCVAQLLTGAGDVRRNDWTTQRECFQRRKVFRPRKTRVAKRKSVLIKRPQGFTRDVAEEMDLIF